MTPTLQSEANKTVPHAETGVARNPLSNKATFALFAVLLLLTSGALSIICSTAADGAKEHFSPRITSSLDFDIICMLILANITAFGWYSFTICKNLDTFIQIFCRGLIFGLPVVVLANTESNTILFWFSFLAFMLASCFGLCIRDRKTTGFGGQLLNVIYVFTSVGCFFITFGSTKYLPYAEPALHLPKVLFFVDLREILGVIMAVVGFTIATVRAFDREMPNPSKLFSLRTSHGIVMQIVYVVPNMFAICMNVLWRFAAVIVIYLSRIVECLISHVWDLYKHKIILRWIFRMVATLAILLLFGMCIAAVSPEADIYLRNDASIFHSSSAIYHALVGIMLSFMLSFVFIAILSWLASFDLDAGTRRIAVEEGVTRAAAAAAVIVVAWWTSGGILYGLTRCEQLHIEGFKHLGLFTGGMLALMIFLLLLDLLRRACPKSA